MEWLSTVLGGLERIFPALVVSKALQRGFLIAPLICLTYLVFIATVRPVGSWFYWQDQYRKRLKASRELAEKVGPAEAEAAALAEVIGLKAQAKNAAS